MGTVFPYFGANALGSVFVLDQQKLTELKFEVLRHPSYLPNLASSDLHLFPKPKTFLAKRGFCLSEEVA